MQVIDFLDKGAARYPDRHLVHDGVSGITYREAQLLTYRIANAIQAAGMGPDSKIAFLTPNHPLSFIAQYGAIRAGAAWLPLNTRNSIDENTDILNVLDAEWMLFHSAYSDDIARVREQCPGIKEYVCIDAANPHGPNLLEWIAEQPERAPEVVRGRDDIFALLTTSGTTGRPKGVMATQLNYESTMASFNATMSFAEPPVHLVAAPLTHAAGLFAATMLAQGGTQLILPRADPALILEWIEKFKVSAMFLPPTLIYMLLSHPDIRKYDYSSMRYFVYGAAPMSAEKLREASSVFGPVFFQIYGQMEALMMMSTMSPAEHQEALSDPGKQKRLMSAGRPGPYVTVGVMDDNGNLLPSGQAGEIVCRGNIVMRGYYNNPAATSEVSQFGWHHTGDIGKFDEDGFLYLVDRKKDMIISGGFNVYPSEVEQVIWTHPAVQDCAVVGIPDEKWGEAVTAIVEVKPGKTVSAEELIVLCKEKLGGVKAPKSVHFWANLPRSSVGKVLKREIRQKFWEGRERMI